MPPKPRPDPAIAYRNAGSPRGDTSDGLRIWLAEEKRRRRADRRRLISNGHAGLLVTGRDGA